MILSDGYYAQGPPEYDCEECHGEGIKIYRSAFGMYYPNTCRNCGGIGIEPPHPSPTAAAPDPQDDGITGNGDAGTR